MMDESVHRGEIQGKQIVGKESKKRMEVSSEKLVIIVGKDS